MAISSQIYTDKETETIILVPLDNNINKKHSKNTLKVIKTLLL